MTSPDRFLPFTDTDLERWKEVARRKYEWEPMPTEEIAALLGRLQAAERFITESRCQNGCTCDGECEKHLPLYRAWEKSTGI